MSGTEADPIYAIGFRLGLPDAEAYARAHASELVAARGADVARDVMLVAVTGDLPAARRLCAVLCPDAVFETHDDGSQVKVTYESGPVRGSLNVSRSPHVRTDIGTALATAAISLEHRLRQLPEWAAVADLDGDGLRERVAFVSAWAGTLHRPGSQRRIQLDGLAARLREPGAVIGDGPDEIPPSDISHVLSGVTTQGDLGMAVTVLMERLDNFEPAAAPRP